MWANNVECWMFQLSNCKIARRHSGGANQGILKCCWISWIRNFQLSNLGFQGQGWGVFNQKVHYSSRREWLLKYCSLSPTGNDEGTDGKGKGSSQDRQARYWIHWFNILLIFERFLFLNLPKWPFSNEWQLSLSYIGCEKVHLIWWLLVRQYFCWQVSTHCAQRCWINQPGLLIITTIIIVRDVFRNKNVCFFISLINGRWPPPSFL